MNRSYVLFLSYGFLIILLPSCGRIVDWGKKTLYQGEELTIDYSVAQEYIRSINAYDQFSTLAHFDALWLSDEVRKLYANTYANLVERNEEQKKILIQRQLEENAHFIVFYVLAPYEITFGNVDSLWTLFLSIDNAYYDPIEIKTVELSQVYRAFFGERYNRFRVAYQLKFDARDINNNQLITSNSKLITLHFRSLQKALTLTWNLPQLAFEKEVQKECALLGQDSPFVVQEKDSSVHSVGDL